VDYRLLIVYSLLVLGIFNAVFVILSNPIQIPDNFTQTTEEKQEL